MFFIREMSWFGLSVLEINGHILILLCRIRFPKLPTFFVYFWNGNLSEIWRKDWYWKIVMNGTNVFFFFREKWNPSFSSIFHRTSLTFFLGFQCTWKLNQIEKGNSNSTPMSISYFKVAFLIYYFSVHGPLVVAVLEIKSDDASHLSVRVKMPSFWTLSWFVQTPNLACS